MELTYRMENGYKIPNLAVQTEPEVHLGKYALLRKKYLMNHRKVLFTNLLTSGKLNSHLMEIEQTALTRLEQMISQMSQAENVTETLKETDQMKWVALMNNLKHSAEETILTELIYN